ncbi:hypothetical protein XELAEV_18005765mg [Xenopus laevis]|uniref:Uncharacterized protein n=1 Tax=Xenopus laevis TaxID=8355 RepID=A0A974I3J0_XENLA|nr:hypothetical protein XELAEV_18005765mg [Xenopus laevis]
MVKSNPVRAREAWYRDLHYLTDSQWVEALRASKQVSYNYNDRLLQLYICYIEPTTPECASQQATLLHSVWQCSQLRTYWEEILAHLSNIVGSKLPLDPGLCLLGIDIGEYTPSEHKQLISRALFQARRQITLNWKSSSPPSVKLWHQAVTSVANKEKIILTRSGLLPRWWGSWQLWLDTDVTCS